jgi:membrane-associated phospholipid phosphatase
LKRSRLASSLIAIGTGISALCFTSRTALASPHPSLAEGISFDERYKPVRPWEYVASAALLAGTIAVRVTETSDARPGNWTGNLLWDFEVTDAIATRDRSAREVWTVLADVPFYALMGYPAVDALLTAGVIWGRWDVAWQLFMMDLEAYAVAAPLIWVTQRFILRERPFMRYACEADTTGKYGVDYEDNCGTRQATRGFPSGHIAIAATGAALTCTHHSHLPLYGGGAGDAAACLTAIGATAVSMLGRVVADKHYVSDVTAGLGIGLFAGWLVPKALHYTFGPRKIYDLKADLRAAKGAAARGGVASFVAFPSPTFGPWGQVDGMGASAVGTF